MTTLATAWPREYADLTSRLEVVGGRIRLATVLQGLARFLLVVGPLTVGLLFVVGYWTLPGWVNVSLEVVLALAVVAAYVGFLHAPLFRRPSYAEIARLVEENGPDPLGNALINAVLLAQDLEAAASKGPLRGSNAWIPHLLRESTHTTAELPLEKRVPWRQPRNAWLAALVAIVLGGTAVALTPGTFAHGLSVLLSPARFVPRLGAVKILNVMPGNDTALLGQPLLFSVQLESPEHKTLEVRLTIWQASGKTFSYPMTVFGGDNSQYVRQGMVAAESIDYMITAGDTQSERFHITVMPQIHLTRYLVESVPPAYTGRGKQTLDLVGKDATAAKTMVEAPLGSKVTVTTALDAPAKEVLMDVPGEPPISMIPDPNGYSAALPLRQSLRFTIRVNDGANRTLRQFPESPDGATGSQEYFSLSALPDSPPTVAVTTPGRDTDAKPGDKLDLEAQATDDYGLTHVQLEIAKNDAKEFAAVQSWPIAAKDGKPARAATVRHTLSLPATDYKFGDTLRYRFTATDNRELQALDTTLGPQTTPGQIFTVSFNDKAATAAASNKLWEELRQKLIVILEKQVALRKSAGELVAGMPVEDIRKIATPVAEGQKGIRTDLAAIAKDFPFEPSMKWVQKSLEVLAVDDATAAVDRSADILLLADNKTLVPLATRLRQSQNRIIDVLQTLLAIVAAEQGQTSRAADQPGGDIPSNARDAWKKLADSLKEFEKEQQKVIDATADLAKKPKDQFDANDQKKLNDLAAIEDKWEKFLNERLADMSKLAQQDMANASLLEEVVQMKVELATAKDALEAKATEIATPLEENALENATELTTHIERWLQQQPDRQNWQMEEPVTQNDPKMAELPEQLQDLVGDLMDKEEDLTQEMESLASKWADSLDKGAGWDAMDGPISNMSAQGVTGNQLPKDMEIQGRSGEGREGRASGEMVGATAEGKEGRRTPTRLTNDPFSNSQVDDKSQLPEGGATGGGKKGGVGGEGLEGPAPAEDPNITQRLAGQQTTIRNEAERLALQMNAAGFNNFKLVEANAYLKKSEDAIKANQYHTALYYQQEAVQSLNSAKVLASGQVHVIADTSPKANEKTMKDIDAALNSPMPKGFSDPVKAYFEKMARQ
jgi:hypothetical protein